MTVRNTLFQGSLGSIHRLGIFPHNIDAVSTFPEREESNTDFEILYQHPSILHPNLYVRWPFGAVSIDNSRRSIL